MGLRLLFDTESNGFVANATKVHCIGIINVDTGQQYGFRPDNIIGRSGALQALNEADVLIGHNIQRHDLPLLKKLYKFEVRPSAQVRDTMVISRLKYPNIKSTDEELIRSGKMPPGKKYKGKHTVASWGYRLGNPKGDYAAIREAEAIAKGITDKDAIARYVWGEFNEEMFEYMMQDCSTNFDMWKHFNPDQYSQDAIELEHDVAIVCNSMEEHGVPFDLRAAGELQAKLKDRQHQLETRLKEQYGFWYQPISPDPRKALFTPKRPNKKAGYWGPITDTWTYTDEKGNERTVNGYPCTKLKLVEFNPGSRDHIAKVLIGQGWKPTKLTEGGKPQIDEEVIESIVARFPEMDGIGELFLVEKRLSQLCGTDNSLMKRCGEDGRIHGVINPMGTITSRAAHMFPNLGQVPSAKKPYGRDFRDLFGRGQGMPKGWVIVGADQEGLELRGLAHYLARFDKGKYSDVVCNGDVHWMHTQVLGLIENGTERDKHNRLHTIVREDGAKRFIYAYVYGCWDNMAGSILYECLLNALRNGGPEGAALYAKFFGGIDAVPGEKKLRQVGKDARDAFLTRIDGFDKLKDAISAQIEKRGRVPGLDGRRIPVRSEHSALNFLVQSAGAIICKRWLVDAYKECCAKFKLGWNGDFVFCWWVHDELGIACRSDIADQVGEIVVRHAKEAGSRYGFRVPLDSKYGVGNSWAEVH